MSRTLRPFCRLVEAWPGSLRGLAGLLGDWEVETDCVDGATAQRPDLPPADFVLADTANHAALEAARLLVVQRQKGGPAVLALCRLDAPTAISQALAIGFDDALAFPMDEIELRLRIEALVQLVAAEKERRRRQQLLDRYAITQPRRRRFTGEREDDGSAILLIGPASENQVRVGNATGKTRVVYAETRRTALRMLGERSFELIVVTLPGAASVPALRPAEILATRRSGEVGILAAGPMEDPRRMQALIDQGFADLVQVPQPPELIRLRLDFWLGLGRLRRDLRRPPAETVSPLALDAPTGLFNQGFLLDHLALLRAERRFPEPLVMVFRLAGLARLQAERGHPAGNFLVAEIGRRLHAEVRAEDLAAGLGDGRFAVTVEGLEEQGALAFAAMVEEKVAARPVQHQGALLPFLLQSTAVPIRPNDDPPRSLLRAFRELESRAPDAG